MPNRHAPTPETGTHRGVAMQILAVQQRALVQVKPEALECLEAFRAAVDSATAGVSAADRVRWPPRMHAMASFMGGAASLGEVAASWGARLPPQAAAACWDPRAV